ncbi:MAG: hypothetical protein WEB88_00825 [Gemmatimonadota bacterium]
MREDSVPLPPVTGGQRDLPPDGNQRPVPPFVASAAEDGVREDVALPEGEEPEGHAGFAWGDDGEEDPALTAELARRGTDAFPMDAFIIPEEADRLPTPSEVFASRELTQDLARRLHAFADALEADGHDAVRRALDDGDRFESLLAGFVAGYLAAQSG